MCLCVVHCYWRIFRKISGQLSASTSIPEEEKNALEWTNSINRIPQTTNTNDMCARISHYCCCCMVSHSTVCHTFSFLFLFFHLNAEWYQYGIILSNIRIVDHLKPISRQNHHFIVRIRRLSRFTPFHLNDTFSANVYNIGRSMDISTHFRMIIKKCLYTRMYADTAAAVVVVLPHLHLFAWCISLSFLIVRSSAHSREKFVFLCLFFFVQSRPFLGILVYLFFFCVRLCVSVLDKNRRMRYGWIMMLWNDDYIILKCLLFLFFRSHTNTHAHTNNFNFKKRF